jgi:hypothetical protein
MPPLRNDSETTTTCPVCAHPFTATGRQRYCAPACRQSAWRARHHDSQPPPPPTSPPRTHRRDITIYECPDCTARHLGVQWCNPCNRPCTRIDFGGLCPNCEEPVAISDLTDQYPSRR